MNLICYEYYTEKLINIVLLNIPTKIHCPYRLFLKDGLFCPGPTLTIGVINLAKVWHLRKGGFVPGGLHNASHLRAKPLRCMTLVLPESACVAAGAPALKRLGSWII